MRSIVLGSTESVLGDGADFMAAGAIFGLAGIASFVTQVLIIIPGLNTGMIFKIAALVFLGWTLLRRLRKPRRTPSPMARIALYARYGMLLALINLCLCFGIFSHWQSTLMPLVPVLVFSIYGGVWLATAGLMTSRWPVLVAGLSYATALVLAVIGTSPWQLLVFGLGMIGLAFFPGLAVQRSFERKRFD